jgi:hydrogenase maturation factor
VKHLPLGKLPPDLLEQMLAGMPVSDPRVKLGPGAGLDCAVLDMGDRLLVVKSDPITFTADEIGRYAVQVCANDIATTGATPRWFLATILLPENTATRELVLNISRQIQRACQAMGVNVVGGHTEITHSLDRPIIMGTMIGEVAINQLVTPRGLESGDRILLTKGVPVESVSILAREFTSQLSGKLSASELQQAANCLLEPGISVVQEARLACQRGRVHGMHDPTEGGLAAALWEFSEASQKTLVFTPGKEIISPLAQKVCDIIQIDPLAAIASGALLIAAPEPDASAIIQACQDSGIACHDIGWVEGNGVSVWCIEGEQRRLLPRPARDEIARLLENR